jgi:prepilin-type N-terminal cleavage/methylation domain-containing protein
MSRRSRAFTLIELLIVIAIIGILIAAIAVAVTKALEFAKVIACRNNLKNVVQAIRTFSEDKGYLPPGRLDYDGGATWAVFVLPYLEHGHLEKQWDYSQRYYVQPAEVRQANVRVFFCPARRTPAEAGMSRNDSHGDVAQSGWPDSNPYPGALGDYAACQGNNGELASTENPEGFNGPRARGAIVLAEYVTSNNQITRWTSRTKMESITDGPSQTIFVGEKHVQLGKFGYANYGGVMTGDGSIFNGDPGNLNACRVAGGDGVHKSIPLARDPKESAYYQFGSWHEGICNFGFGDTSVRGVRVQIDDLNLGRLACRDDGEAITSTDW